MHVPPRSARSTRATWRPAFASRTARGTPACPLPRIRTSTRDAIPANLARDAPEPTDDGRRGWWINRLGRSYLGRLVERLLEDAGAESFLDRTCSFSRIEL